MWQADKLIHVGIIRLVVASTQTTHSHEYNVASWGKQTFNVYWEEGQDRSLSPPSYASMFTVVFVNLVVSCTPAAHKEISPVAKANESRVFDRVDVCILKHKQGM